MNETIIPRPNCVDCFDWGVGGITKVLVMNITVIIIGGILIQILIHWIKNHEIKLKLFDAIYWMLILGIVEVGYFYIQSILYKYRL